MFPRNYCFAGEAGASRSSNAITRRRSCGPESTRWKSQHVLNHNLSEEDLPLIVRHVDGSERLDLHRTDRDLHRMDDIAICRDDRDLHRTDCIAMAIFIVIFIDRTAGGELSSRSRSDGLEGLWKNSTIAVRSNRDHTAIEQQSCSFSTESSDRSFPLHLMAIDGASTSRSTPDRGAIVARSRPDQGAIVAPIEAESMPIHGQFWNHEIFN